MSDLVKIFENEQFGKIRMVVIDGKPYAVGVDVARALEYARPADAITAHCEGSVKYRVPTNGGMQEVKAIPQGDIIRLIVGASKQSKNETIKEKAKKFESWIFDEVIPTVLETGSYSVKQAPAIDTAKQMRAEATLMNAQTRKAQLIWKIAKDSDNGLYRQAGEALAMNLLAGKIVVAPPQDEQRPNHELGHFCQFIDKPETWATQLGKVLKKNGIEKTAESGVWRVIWDKKNNQRKSFYWFDSYLMPILVKLFPKDEVEDAKTD
jgi:prophage antirepressor-like protein